MQRTATQDPQTLFRSVLRQHAGLILKVAGGFAHTGPDRDDLTQEILLQLWRAMPTFEPRAKVSTWIYRVALNTALAWRRKEKRNAAHVPLFEVQELPAASGGGELAQDRELVDALYAAIRKLPRVDACLMMMHLDDLSYREMADVLGISEDNVGVKLSRARRALAESMKGLSYDSR